MLQKKIENGLREFKNSCLPMKNKEIRYFKMMMICFIFMKNATSQKKISLLIIRSRIIPTSSGASGITPILRVGRPMRTFLKNIT